MVLIFRVISWNICKQKYVSAFFYFKLKLCNIINFSKHLVTFMFIFLESTVLFRYVLRKYFALKGWSMLLCRPYLFLHTFTCISSYEHVSKHFERVFFPLLSCSIVQQTNLKQLYITTAVLCSKVYNLCICLIMHAIF